jgi:hypothetical protein
LIGNSVFYEAGPMADATELRWAIDQASTSSLNEGNSGRYERHHIKYVSVVEQSAT